MQLTERHVIDRNDPRYLVIDQAAFASKNLYNAALYLIRQSYIFEGKYLTYNTSVNQYYNKRTAELQSKLGRTGTTKRMERMTNKRNRRIDQYLHTASRWIIDDLVAHGIGTLIIGKNDRWKQEPLWANGTIKTLSRSLMLVSFLC